MTSHLDIQIDNLPMALPDDFSLDVTEENPLFNDNGMYSTPVSAPMEGNRHIFSNVDDPQSDKRPVDMEYKPANIGVEGIPFRHGTVVIQNDEELKDSFSFNIDESAQSFSDLIGDLKCQDIPLFNNEKIPIGEKICDVHVTGKYHSYITVGFSHFPNFDVDRGTKDFEGTFNPQALGFSYPGKGVAAPTRSWEEGDTMTAASGGEKCYPEDNIVVKMPAVVEDFINVSEPYTTVGGRPAEGAWRYCNARVCYTHYGVDRAKRIDDVYEDGVLKYKGTIGETTSDIEKVSNNYGNNEDYGPNWVLDARRPQSGICFYVLYFLDCLFNYLGVSFDNSAIANIEDLRRLCFFTTHCRYVTEESSRDEYLGSLEQINGWLDERGCGGRLEFAKLENKSLDGVTLLPGDEFVGEFFEGNKYYIVGETYDLPIPYGFYTKSKLDAATGHGEFISGGATAYVRTMYATNENFPDESVKTILDSLENSFGIRFHYDYQLNKVTAYLLRDVFRQRNADGTAIPTITLPATVLEVSKLSEKITGVRMKYSAESDSKEQQDNVRRAKRDYETDFDYIDYRDGRTTVCEGYRRVIEDLHAENVTCYVDKLTGNAFRYKISKEVDSGDVSYHRLFEVGQYHGIEVGDCSRRNEDFIKELVSDFQPISFNDVNAFAQVKRKSNKSILAAYVDEDMEHEFVTQKINQPLASDFVDVYMTEVLNLVESYDPSSTDDGNSPLQTYDWGLAVAIMRGGGADATIQHYDHGYDGFGNDKWRVIAGEYALTSDTMDQFGSTYDYNGTEEGDGGGERFSLKIRSYKPFLYYIDAQGKTHTTTDLSLLGQPITSGSDITWERPCIGNREVALRGLADVFMAEYIWFLLHRRKLRLHCQVETAALVDIPNHWRQRFRIGDYVGYIDKLGYSIRKDTGIGEVTIDFFAV